MISNKYLLVACFALPIFSSMNNAYADHKAIDTVLNFKPGKLQFIGQSPEYFPKNIFSLPPESASLTAPANKAEDVCSIGMDGEIILGFKDYEIIDGPGADFTIFENVFKNEMTGKYFVEPAQISVSSDGINFIDFPFDTISLKGCAGITPTNGASDFYNPKESGGDQFDLSEIGLKSARWIKIKDITRILIDYPNHPNFDPTLSGFDLDCIVGLNLKKISSGLSEDNSNINFIETSEAVEIKSIERFDLKIYNYCGDIVYSGDFSSNIRINKSSLASGAYFGVAVDGNSIKKFKFTVVK